MRKDKQTQSIQSLCLTVRASLVKARHLIYMRKYLSYDPSMADSGVLAKDLSYTDTYFTNDTPEENSEVKVIETLLAELPERQRVAIEMCIFSQITYTEAARLNNCSDQTMRRETLRALAFLKSRLEGTPWLVSIMNYKYVEPTTLSSEELPEL